VVIELTSVAAQSLAAMPAADGRPLPADRRSRGSTSGLPETGPMNAAPSARYTCSLCEVISSYRLVRHTGRCPACGGGLLRQPDTSAGYGAVLDEPIPLKTSAC